MSTQTTYTNGKVALTKQFIFGICVMSESGWFPIKDCSVQDLKMILDLIDYDPLCPYTDDIRKQLAIEKEANMKA
jgi:hypothetical protein